MLTKILGDRVVLKGNIDPVTILQKNSEDIELIVNELINKVKDQKFILSGGCEIIVDTPVENLIAMQKSASVNKYSFS